MIGIATVILAPSSSTFTPSTGILRWDGPALPELGFFRLDLPKHALYVGSRKGWYIIEMIDGNSGYVWERVESKDVP